MFNGPGALLSMVGAISVILMATAGVWVLFKLARLIDRVNARLDALGGVVGEAAQSPASELSAEVGEATVVDAGPARPKDGGPIAYVCTECGRRYNLPKPGAYSCKCGARIIV